MTNKEIYIHIPFCKRKCAYCDFLSFPGSESQQRDYVNALLAEIQTEPEGGSVSAIFFGGGTPSLLDATEIQRIMEVLKEKYDLTEDAEITIEANPGTLDREKLEIYRKAGINRLSLGLQSAHNQELQTLGRIHTWEEFLESFQLAREAGFSNINVDLMSALPGQSPDDWRDTLKKVADLNPEHISAYSLIIEEGTPFYDKYEQEEEQREAGNSCKLLPTEEEERQMYYDTEKLLQAAGYHRYEISNYAKAGRECRHNCGYWRRVDYRGFGLGAASLIREVRFTNTRSLEEYLNRDFLRREEEILTTQAQMEEFMFLGLRLCIGISIKEFEKKFQCSFEEV